MSYNCQHCQAELDNGDVFEFFLKQTKDADLAEKNAKLYGWTETNRIHFQKAIIIQPTSGPQFVICPYCREQDPLPNIEL